jgi:hypothetical protein
LSDTKAGYRFKEAEVCGHGAALASGWYLFISSGNTCLPAFCSLSALAGRSTFCGFLSLAGFRSHGPITFQLGGSESSRSSLTQWVEISGKKSAREHCGVMPN